MSHSAMEQRNSCKGKSLRAWLRVKLIATNGTEQEMDAIADTANPYPLIVSVATMTRFGIFTGAPPSLSNYGTMRMGWIRVVIPDVGFDQSIESYDNDRVVASAQKSSSDFQGMVGLPLLRQFIFGGDVDSFWIQPAAATP